MPDLTQSLPGPSDGGDRARTDGLREPLVGPDVVRGEGEDARRPVDDPTDVGDVPSAPHAKRVRRTGAAGTNDGVPSFAALLCDRHRSWVVDRTRAGTVPPGWRALLEAVFADASTVLAGQRVRFALRRLEEAEGGLALGLDPLGTRRPRTDPCVAAVGLIVSHATNAARLTCRVCGAPGRPRPSLGFAALCDEHAAPWRGDEGGWSFVRSTPRPSREPDHRRDDGPAVARVALYETADVRAALGQRSEQADLLGDPEPCGDGEPDTAQTSYLRRVLRGGEEARWRGLATPAVEQLDLLGALARRVPHMRELTDLVELHLRASMAMGTPTRLPPLMLLGDPGVGKTWVAERVAGLLGVPFRSHPMNVATTGESLTGAHPVWRGARAGLVARVLLAEPVANPVLVVDEVDKPMSHGGEDPFRPLYGLLEPSSARRHVDEFLSFPLDASHVTWILAGNSIEPLPEPIVDRLTVVEVPPPDAGHRRAVAASVFDELNAERGRHFEQVGDDVTDRLASTTPRRMRRAIVEAMARAAAAGRRTLLPDDVVVEAGPTRRRFGFRPCP